MFYSTLQTKTEAKEELSNGLSNTDEDELHDPEFFSNGNKLVGPDISIMGRFFNTNRYYPCYTFSFP